MKTYLVNLWDSLRSSFWFVPAMFGVVALLVAIAMPMLDASLQIQHPAWLLTTTDAARATLSTIVGAMMGITNASRDAQSNIGMLDMQNRMLDRLINQYARIS